jgi:chlorobactene glucosyltransferase
MPVSSHRSAGLCLCRPRTRHAIPSPALAGRPRAREHCSASPVCDLTPAATFGATGRDCDAGLHVSFLIPSVTWAVLVFWLITRAFKQRSALSLLKTAPTQQPESLPALTVIVPARDEAENIGRCLGSLLAQDYPRDRLRILVVDDDSSDATPAIVAEFAKYDGRVALLRSPHLPPGWKGKVNACCAGVSAADEQSEWLCFLDADMQTEPALLRSAVSAAREHELDLLSLAPRQELKSFAERLILPCGLYLLSFSQDLNKIQAPDSKEVVATGQFMLIRRDTYDYVGGLATVCHSIVEDLEFARLLKRSGYRVLMMDGTHLLSTRMYTGWQTLWPGFAKNLIDLVGGARALLATAVVALAMAWAAVLLPLIDGLACAGGNHDACLAAIPAGLGAVAAFGLHIGGALYFRIPIVYGLIFPLGYTAGALIAFDSLRWRLRRRVTWKGRVYR